MLRNTRYHIMWKQNKWYTTDIRLCSFYICLFNGFTATIYIGILFSFRKWTTVINCCRKTLLRMEIPVSNIKSAINNFIKSNGEYYYHILQFMLQLWNTKYWWRFPRNNIFKLVFMWRIGDALLIRDCQVRLW
jgi:hypothetical protein